MTTIMTFALAATLLVGTALAQTVNFDSFTSGAPPPGWTATKTGSGNPKWTVERDDSAPSKPNVLKQSGQATYPVCIKDDTSLKDGFVEVKFKPISGKEDQAGGIVVRLIDRNNYYLARANALENNVHFFRVVRGNRQELAGANTRVASGSWHTLTLRAEGNRFTVSLDGKQLFTHTDRTFNAPGKVALWTKADSVTLFDWIDVKPLKER